MEFLKFREKDHSGNWILKYMFEVAEEESAKIEKALKPLGISFRTPSR